MVGTMTLTVIVAVAVWLTPEVVVALTFTYTVEAEVLSATEMETVLFATEAVTPPAVEEDENVPGVVDVLALTVRETLDASILNVGVHVYVSPGLR